MYVRFTPRDSALSVGASAEYADSADHDVNDEWAGALLVTYAESGWIAALNVDVSHEMNAGAGDDPMTTRALAGRSDSLRWWSDVHDSTRLRQQVVYVAHRVGRCSGD